MSDTLEWAVNNVKLPKGAKWDFSDRVWQLQILNDDSQRIVCRKPTQVGMSTVFLIKMLHFADIVSSRLLYTLPRQDDVYDMVNSRLHDIIKESPYIRDAISEVDNVRMKKFKQSWLHFLEMSVEPRMLDADWMVNDEVDLSNQRNLQESISRLDASKIKIHHQISKPSIEGYGIDVSYQMSDKKEWFIKCGYCNYEQSLNWDINLETGKKGTYYKCAKCSRQIFPQDIAEGRWIATGNSNADFSGYQISQMMMPRLSPEDLYREYRKIDRKIFYNSRLGIPYSAQSASFERQTIVEKCISGEVKKRNHYDDGIYVVGCDQGNILHVCVAKIFQNNIDIVNLTTLDSFDELVTLIKKYNIRIGILDALPNHHSAMKVNEELKKVRLAFFNNVDRIYVSKDERIYINKTDAYDMLLQNILDGKIRIYTDSGSISQEVNAAISHITNMRRDIQTQTTPFGGVSTFHVWKSIGPDHYADAIVYAMIGADSIASKHRLQSQQIATTNASRLSDIFFKLQNDLLVPVFENDDSEMRIVNHGLAHDNPYRNRGAK